MANFKIKLTRNFPYLAGVYRALLNRRENVTFSGWGMTTAKTNPPWMNSFPECQLDSVSGFEKANNYLISRVQNKQFNLTQFADKESVVDVLKGLMWRHYIVYWSALFAAERTTSLRKNLVECGVCDGLTVCYAMKAAEHAGKGYSAYLYDAWDVIKEDYLLDSEKSKAGRYSYLHMDTTARNLTDFSSNVVFNKGYIPDSFSQANNPSDLVWLHIDLNSAIPTEASLEFFYDKVLPGGVILFDDYGWRGYVETKRSIDSYFHKKDVKLLQFPTGQAIVFKV
jgi:O-methyltransferase